MCGLAGYLLRHPEGSVDSGSVLNGMMNALVHRGPDDCGVWSDSSAGIGLAHRRLSIADLSSAGHQPMHSACGRYVIAFNGEIYNHTNLRVRLGQEGITQRWRGHSDTETLVACLSHWGPKRTLEALVGMFAFAFWDKQCRVLTLARDRMGEKPLYWGWQDGVLLFGSELKALKANRACRAEINRDALTLLLRYNYIPAPYSIYRDIWKLEPGHYVSISTNTPLAQPESYWELKTALSAGLAAPFGGTDIDAVRQLESQLSTSIGGQMLADVPVGAFLSGGVDSSLVAALMQQQSPAPVRTYAIGFEDKAFDEAIYARAVASHLATDHSELYISERDALNVVPSLAKIYCEPFADSSQIPTFLVSRMASSHVKVALSGDGGDELFGGYNPYKFMPKLWGFLRKVPAPIRRMLASGLASVPISQRLEKLLSIFPAKDREQLYFALRSHWLHPETAVLGAREPASLLREPDGWSFIRSFENWMMALDARDYMSNDILVKVDRAAMANSLETRIPLLDHRVVEFAASLPLDMKIRNGQGKWILRQLLYQYVPKELIERPKAGFMVPLGSWLRGPLREWAEGLLDQTKLRNQEYFDSALVHKVWQEHLSGRFDRSSQLWSILMFQAWLETQ